MPVVSAASESQHRVKIDARDGNDTGTCTAATPAEKLPRELRVALLNARGILKKLGELEHTVLKGFHRPPDVIAVNETWLSDQVPDSTIVLPGYATVHRSDQPVSERKCRGGGVLILVKDGLCCWRQPDLQSRPESIWIEVSTARSSSLVIGCFYRLPSSSTSDIDEFAG